MATINQDSMQSDIIAAIKKNNIRTLFKDLKNVIKTAEIEGLKKNGDFLTRVLRYVSKCHAFKSEGNLTCEELLNVFKSIEFCINNIVKHYEPEDIQNIPNGQFLTTWFHIICHLLRKKYDKFALRLITTFENYIQKALHSSIKTYLITYNVNLCYVLCQSATNHENLGAEEIFKRQLLGLQLLSFDCQHIYPFCEYSTWSLQQYYKVEKTEFNVISYFLRTVWCHSDEYLRSCSTSCAKLLVFQTSCKWFTIFQQEHINEFILDFLSMFDYLNKAVQRFKCSHAAPLEAMTEIILFCIKSYMNETVKTLPKKIQWCEILLKTDGKSPEALCMSYGYQVFILCLSWQARMCISGSLIGPDLELMQNNIEAFSAVSCMYLNYFELIHTTQDLVDYRNIVISSILCIILKIMEQINCTAGILHLIPVSIFYFKKVSLLFARSDIESQEIYCDALSGIAKQFLKHHFYEEAVPFLQFVINKALCYVILAKDVQIKSNETEIWELSKCLSYCYLFFQKYNQALKSLVIGLLSKKKITPLDFQYWVKIKHSAHDKKKLDIVKKTVQDVLTEMNLSVCQKKEIKLLENVLVALKKDDGKDYIYKERVAVILLILASDPEPETKAWILIELSITTVPLSSVPAIDRNSTRFSLCQQAADLLIQALEINSNNTYCMAMLSFAYFWMHHHQTGKILDLNLQRVKSEFKKEAKKCQDKTYTEDENQQEYGFLPAFLNLRLGIENQLLKYLRDALNIWKKIVHNLEKGKADVTELHKFNLCKVMLKTAEIFSVSGNENEALVASFILHRFSVLSDNKIYDLLSLSSIINLATRQGYRRLAKEYIIFAEECLRDITDVKIYPKVVFSCAKSLFLLENGEFDKGLEILHSAFKDVVPILSTSKGLALQIEASLILVRYLQLKKSVYSKIRPNYIRGCPFDPITLATQCFCDSQELLNVFFTGGFSTFAELENCLNQKIIRLQFESAVVVCELLLYVGLPTKAKFFLALVTPIAESYFYTNWVSKFLIIWSHADLMCNDYVYCEMKLKALDYLFKVKVDENCDLESFVVDSSLEDSEEDDDSLLQTVSDVSNKTDFRLAFRKGFSCESTSVKQRGTTAQGSSCSILKGRAKNIDCLVDDLKEAIATIKHFPSQPLYSDLCKLLASLMMLRLNDCAYSYAFDVAYLLSDSFAVSLKNESRFALDQKIGKAFSERYKQNLSDELGWPISCMIDYSEMNFETQEDVPFYTRMKILLKNIPEQWTVVQICILQNPLNYGEKPEQNLCICRCRRNSIPYIKLFNIADRTVDDLNSEFNDICHQASLSNEIKDNKLFWQTRLALDSQMKNFINNLSTRWSAKFKALFLGVLDDERRKKRLESSVKMLINCLPRKIDEEMLRIVLDCADALRHHEISSIICDLYNICREDQRHTTIMKYIHRENFDLGNVKRHPVILILDKYIQSLPWESMPVMRSNPVVREPSLYFLNLQLKLYCNEFNSLIVDGVDTKNTFYLLNAGGDLKKTQHTFEDVFSVGMQWKGVAGRKPSLREIAGALTDYDLYLYLGHSSGLQYLKDAGNIKALCGKASAILMGCSSGSLRRDGFEMEATGSVMKYYLSGVPCILANLWDVTDGDIDMYTYTVLQDWVPGFKTKPLSNKWDIAEVVARARRVCTLIYLNGAAPVIYGLPVFAKWNV